MNHLVLFAKHWTPGQVKTRLAADIGDTQAAAIYRQFVATLTERLAGHGDQRTVYFAPDDRRAEFAQLAGYRWQLAPQTAGELGRRIQVMFEQQLRNNDCRLVLLGTDSPNVPLGHVDQAFAALDTARLVLGPTEDGGYYLIGARGTLPPVFDGLPFSTPQLWQATLLRLSDVGWQPGADYAVLRPWYDVDTVADLARLKDDLVQASPPTDDPLRRLLSAIELP